MYQKKLQVLVYIKNICKDKEPEKSDVANPEEAEAEVKKGKGGKKKADRTDGGGKGNGGKVGKGPKAGGGEDPDGARDGTVRPEPYLIRCFGLKDSSEIA